MIPIAEWARRVEAAQSQRIARAVAARRAMDPAGAGEVVVLGPGVRIHWDGPDSLLSRCVGVGFERGQRDADIRAWVAGIAAFHAGRGPARVDLCPYADPRWQRALSDRGFVITGFKQVFGRRVAGPTPDASVTGLDVHQARTDADFDAYARTVVSAIAGDGPPIATHYFGRIRHQDHASAWVLREGDRCVGGGTLALEAGVAELYGTAVVPEARRRGGQALLLRARLAAAADAGAELATVSATPGSGSERNALRAGFEPLYTQVLLALP